MRRLTGMILGVLTFSLIGMSTSTSAGWRRGQAANGSNPRGGIVGQVVQVAPRIPGVPRIPGMQIKGMPNVPGMPGLPGIGSLPGLIGKLR